MRTTTPKEPQPPLDEFVAFAHRLAEASGKVIRPWFRMRDMEVTDKGTGRAGFDPVTEADKAAETVMRRMIKETYPTHGILGEEHGHEQGQGDGSAFTWVLDPIDGTRAFICGLAQWGTLIALNDGERPILGVLDQPITHERWIGRRDEAGASANANASANASANANANAELVTQTQGIQKIRTRACASLASAVLMTTHPTAYFDQSEREAFERVSALTKMTRFGGDCYMYGLLAMGFIDLIVEASLKTWDVQALIPIVEGAGGVFTSWDGGDPQQGGRIIAAGDARTHAEAVTLLTAASRS